MIVPARIVCTDRLLQAMDEGVFEQVWGAYKDIDEGIEAASLAGISRPMVRFRPIGNVKG